MNQGIQVIDQLRADRPLSEHKLYGRPGATGVSVDYLDKGAVRLCRSKALLINQRLEQTGQSVQGIFGVLKLGAYLCPRSTLFVASNSLGGIGKHELVGRFNGVDALFKPAFRGEIQGRTFDRLAHDAPARWDPASLCFAAEAAVAALVFPPTGQRPWL